METLFGEILFGGIKRLGALIRWIFQSDKKYAEVLEQSYNKTVGILLVSLIILILVWVL